MKLPVILSGLAEVMLVEHNKGMAILLVIVAAGLAGLALYRFGEVRGAWLRWRAAVGILRTRRTEAVRFFGWAALFAVGAVVALILAVRLLGRTSADSRQAIKGKWRVTWTDARMA